MYKEADYNSKFEGVRCSLNDTTEWTMRCKATNCFYGELYMPYALNVIDKCTDAWQNFGFLRSCARPATFLDNCADDFISPQHNMVNIISRARKLQQVCSYPL